MKKNKKPMDAEKKWKIIKVSCMGCATLLLIVAMILVIVFLK